MMVSSPSDAANTHSSPASSLSSSFSVLISTPSDDPFEAIHGTSSDDEVVWPIDRLDPEEDFILIPHVHHSSPTPVEEVTGTSTPAHEPLHEAFAQLSLASPKMSNPPAPRVRKVKHQSLAKEKGRRSAGNRSDDVSEPRLASTAPPSAFRVPRGRRRRGRRDAAAAASYPSPSPSPTQEFVDRIVERKAEYGFGSRPLIEDSDVEEEVCGVKRYEDAVCYITYFLSNPTSALSCSTNQRLTFLQSLIIELGLLSPSSTLPSSMKAAKHLLKTRAFINIGEYLSVREQGLEKLREVMFPSRQELTSDLRKRKGGCRANKGWVKRHGLNVLLVSVF